MRKILAFIAALTLATLALVTPSAASATEPSENKKVTLCHATGSETNPYTKITVSVNAFYNAGHIDHGGDIWEAFSYTNNRGEVVNVPAQGNTALLAFDNCEEPKVDEEIVAPEPVVVDKCETADDAFSVAPGRGYTVGPVVKDGLTWSITVTANEGFTFADGQKSVTFTHTFTDVDCDLPQTGVGATFNTTGGFAALGALAFGLFMLVKGGRKVHA